MMELFIYDFLSHFEEINNFLSSSSSMVAFIREIKLTSPYRYEAHDHDALPHDYQANYIYNTDKLAYST